MLDANVYFLTEDCEAIAARGMDNARQFLSQRGLSLISAEIPYVCGAAQDAQDLPQPVAAYEGAEASHLFPPFTQADGMESEPEFQAAIRALAGHFPSSNQLYAGLTGARPSKEKAALGGGPRAAGPGRRGLERRAPGRASQHSDKAPAKPERRCSPPLLA